MEALNKFHIIVNKHFEYDVHNMLHHDKIIDSAIWETYLCSSTRCKNVIPILTVKNVCILKINMYLILINLVLVKSIILGEYEIFCMYLLDNLN